MSAGPGVEARRYRFGPLARNGGIAGWRGGQLAAVGTALVAAVLVLRACSRPPGLAAAVALVAAGGLSAAWPVAGLTVEQWVPVLARWRLGGRRSWVNPRPAAGRVGHPSTGPASDPARLRVLGGCSIVATPVPGGGSAGVFRDARDGSCSAVIAASGQGFALLGPAERDQQVASWSSLLAGLARDRSPVDRLQWVARTLPDSGEAVRRWDRDARPPWARAAGRSYEELLEVEAVRFLRRETFVVVRVSERRMSGRWRGSHSDAAFDALMREATSVCAELSSAGVVVEGVLDVVSLEQVVAEACGDGGSGAPPGLQPGGPWPMGTRAEWDRYVTDRLTHVVYWIAEWPRIEVGADFLAPLLLAGSHRVTVSVTMEPLEAGVATRRVENARVTRRADDELRRRGGFSVSARRRREEESLSVRETELADGHAPFRFSGYVGVSARAADELEVACAAVEQAASRSFLSLRRLYGDQERAFSWLLPIGRGLS